MSTLIFQNRSVKKAHQGAMVAEWITKNHDSVHRLAGKIAADAPPKERNKVMASVVNLLGRSIPHHEFLAPQWHKKWEKKVTPTTGYTLEDVLKETGEDSERSQGYVTAGYQKELYILKGKYEGVMEAFQYLSKEVREILLSSKNE